MMTETLVETMRLGLRAATARMRKLLFDTAVAANLVEGRDDYVKFVILGRGRTGSNFLRTSLASHDDVVVFGELFNNAARQRGEISWGGYPGYKSNGAKLVSLRDQNPLEFLDHAVFGRMPKHVGAVGFKLFYYHAKQDDWRGVWPHLKDIGVRAIHLKRRNLLATHVSGMMAERTGQWMRESSYGEFPAEPVVLNCDGCLRFFARTKAMQTECARYFDRTLDLYYEDLVADYEAQTYIVQDFLGVPRQALSSPLKKQSKRPLRESIANFDQLKKEFAGTEWSNFFE